MQHDPKSILQVFDDIDKGKYNQASFSDANVVMINKKLYDTLIDQIDNLLKFKFQ